MANTPSTRAAPSLSKRIFGLQALPDAPELTQSLGDRLPYSVYYDLPTPKTNITSTDASTAKFPLFTLTAPETDRQPVYTAANWYVEQSRQNFADFEGYPVVYSEYGATAPVTLAQLDNPVPANTVPNSTMVTTTMAVDGKEETVRLESELLKVTTPYATIWGATRTTTLQTTVLAEPGDVVFLRFPTVTTTPPAEYTTMSALTAAGSKNFPDGLPVLVLTEVDGVIVDSTASTTFLTATVIQAPPLPFTTDADAEKYGLAPPSYRWATWSSAERGGVIAATVVAAVVVMAMAVFLCMIRHKRKKADEEDRKREEEDRKGLVGRLRDIMEGGAVGEKAADEGGESRGVGEGGEKEGEGEKKGEGKGGDVEVKGKDDEGGQEGTDEPQGSSGQTQPAEIKSVADSDQTPKATGGNMSDSDTYLDQQTSPDLTGSSRIQGKAARVLGQEV